MTVFMPIFFLLMFYNAPSGLTLYMMASIAGGVLESWVIRKHIREQRGGRGGRADHHRRSGQGPRGSRPKKPKGPRFFK